jgi:WD40 repeat protein
MVTGRTVHTATLLSDGRVLAAGGSGQGTDALASAELYDPATGVWIGTGSLNTGRHNHTATLLPNGKVLVAGGGFAVPGLLGRAIFNYLASAELYDPVTGIWTATGAMTTVRADQTATLLLTGTVLVVGGTSNLGILGSAELYDPATGRWTATGSVAFLRTNHSATLLPDGRVLVAGGCCVPGSITALPSPWTSAELYDPAAGIWTSTGSLSAGRLHHTATLLPNGKVLVAGGEDGRGEPFASAELYDPATGVWTSTGSLTMPRTSHTATLLPNGRVLVAGGRSSVFLDQPPVASAELYDPVAGSWISTGSMIAARFLSTATSLPNGKVLEAGGSSVLASAELYQP